MANIKRRLENLKPGKEYILTVRSKNPDLNTSSDFAESIRFTVPTDGSIPSDINNLNLYSGVESVMFVFDFSEDKDISRYEYELYDTSQVELIDGVYQPIESSDPISSGFNDANVFTVTIDNLQVATPEFNETTGLKKFLGRVRGIDTSGNAGVWTLLTETDSRTPLIDNQFIGSLTADKIRAGTIEGQTITLAGANSIIKSSTYSQGISGWKIQGDGTAEFGEASIRGSIEGGTIDIGGNDDTSFHVDATGRMWAGSPYFDTAKFRVDNNGVVRIGNEGATPISLWIDQTGAISIGSTPNTGEFVVSSTGQISVGGNDSTSFHINSDGTVTSGDIIESATPPFRLNNDGSIDIGGQDASSMHILSNGNVQVGASKSSIYSGQLVITGASANATNMTYTCLNHGLSVGQTISVTGISSSPANKYNHNNMVITEVTTNTISVSNPLIIPITAVSASAGSVTYTTSKEHRLNVGQRVIILGITPSGYNGTFSVTECVSSTQFKVTNATTGTATLANATARGAGTGSDTIVYNSSPNARVRVASPFNITASNGNVRTTDIDVTGTISGTGNHLNLGGILRINDTIAIGSSTIRATTSLSSYDEGVNFSLNAASGFVARVGTVVGITIDDSGYESILPITGSTIRASSNGSAAAPAYKFATTNDGFYTDGINPFWSNGGTGYRVLHTGAVVDADTLDNIDSAGFVQTSGTQTIGGAKTFTSGIEFNSSLIKDSNVAYTGSYASWSGTSGGNMGYRSSSSSRYKDNIASINNVGLNPDNLLNIPIIEFKYKLGYLGEGDQKIDVLLPGFLAEDVQVHYPAAGTVNEDGSAESWDPFFIIPPMLKLIQDLYKKIEILEETVNNLT